MMASEDIGFVASSGHVVVPTQIFGENRHRHRCRSVFQSCNLRGSCVLAGAPSRCSDPPPRNTPPVGERSVQMHAPLGPNGRWKTGQRVPVSGTWTDQYGLVTYHEKGSTFPPCIDRKGECAHRELIQEKQSFAA